TFVRNSYPDVMASMLYGAVVMIAGNKLGHDAAASWIFLDHILNLGIGSMHEHFKFVPPAHIHALGDISCVVDRIYSFSVEHIIECVKVSELLPLTAQVRI